MTLRLPSADLLPPQHRANALRQLHPETFTIKKGVMDSVVVHTAQPKKRRNDEEHQEQVAFFDRIKELAMVDRRYELAVRRTFAIPNGGHRSKREAGRLKAEGVRAGVSDIFAAIPSGTCHGLFLEMKSMTGFPSREQKEWLAESADEGYAAACCRGANEAYRVWKDYVDGAL